MTYEGFKHGQQRASFRSLYISIKVGEINICCTAWGAGRVAIQGCTDIYHDSCFCLASPGDWREDHGVVLRVPVQGLVAGGAGSTGLPASQRAHCGQFVASLLELMKDRYEASSICFRDLSEKEQLSYDNIPNWWDTVDSTVLNLVLSCAHVLYVCTQLS